MGTAVVWHPGFSEDDPLGMNGLGNPADDGPVEPFAVGSPFVHGQVIVAHSPRQGKGALEALLVGQ
jgi:hypothetical protein